MKSNIVFSGTKLSSSFNVKDSVPFTEKQVVIYRSVCATESCNEDYACEYARRLCHLSHLVKHAGEIDHLPVDTANFEVIGSGCRNNARRRNIAEALLVKKLTPTFNIQ